MALMFADRAQSIATVIEPALAAGSIVLCDRFTDSSEAYQGAGRRLGSERILAMHAAVCNNLQPDLTLLLLPPLKASLTRARRRNHRSAQKNGADENRFERESDAFYTRIHAAYKKIAAREPQRVVTIANDPAGKNTIDAIELRIRAIVEQRLNPGHNPESSALVNPIADDLQPAPRPQIPALLLFEPALGQVRSAHPALRAPARTYGNIAHYSFLGTPIIFVNDPEYVREILINQASSFVKERTVRRMKILLGEGLITSDDPIHKRQRKIAAPAFHRQRIAAYGDKIVAIAAHTSATWQPARPSTSPPP
jgi:thymidylate kinase